MGGRTSKWAEAGFKNGQKSNPKMDEAWTQKWTEIGPKNGPGA